MRCKGTPARQSLEGCVPAVQKLLFVLLGSAAVALSGCASTSLRDGPAVQQLSQAHYAPTQTVDVLSAPPTVPYEALARFTLADPTATATSSQLLAQMDEAAKNLGANALLVEHLSRSGKPDVAFNPAGGQMQDSGSGGAWSVTALAIRYTH